MLLWRSPPAQRWYDTYVPSFSLPKLFVVVSICVLSPVPCPHSTERIMIKSSHSFFMLLTATLHHCTHHRKARTVFSVTAISVMRLHQLSSSLTTVCGFHVYAPQMSTTRTSCAIPRKHYNIHNTEPSRGRRMVPHSRTITTALYYARSSNQKIAQDSQEKVNQGKKFVVEAQNAVVEAQNALVEAQRALVETQQALAESNGQLDDIEKAYEALAPWDPRRYFKLQDIRDAKNRVQHAKQDIRDAKQDTRDAEQDIRDAQQDIRDAETDLKGFERQVERCIEWTDDDTCRKATDFLMNRGIFEQKRQRFKTIQNVVTCDVVERFEDIVDGAGYKGSD